MPSQGLGGSHGNGIAAFNPQAEREPCLRALIEANANLEATDDDGDTALMMAAQDACRRSAGPSTPCMCCLCLRGPQSAARAAPTNSGAPS